MKTRRIKSFFAGVPSWALSIIAVVFIAVFIGIINDIGEVPSYLIYAVLVITASLLIAWNNPRSAWYVPILCNIFSFLMPFLDDSFWTSSLGIIVSIEAIFSVIAAIIGARLGRRKVPV
jgi:hypothetical protein